MLAFGGNSPARDRVRAEGAVLASLLRRHVGVLLGDRLIGGADDFAVVDELLNAVGAPAGDAGYGKEGGEEFFGEIEHAVDEAGVKVDVGADAFVDFSQVANDGGGKLLDF